jgi:hypothetical protein
MEPEQHHLALRCARCGRDLASLEELAELARQAHHGLDTMRLALPDVVRFGVRELDVALACHAGICTSHEEG